MNDNIKKDIIFDRILVNGGIMYQVLLDQSHSGGGLHFTHEISIAFFIKNENPCLSQAWEITPGGDGIYNETEEFEEVHPGLLTKLCDMVLSGEAQFRKCNTKFSYLYRDASNYKMPNEVVLHGIYTDDLIEKILESLHEGIYFIPSQVDLPEKRFDEISDDDHCWFEVQGKEAFEVTDEFATVSMSMIQLADIFSHAADNWDEVSATERLWE